MKKERFECQIYARLLLIIICWKIFSLDNDAVVMAHNLNAMVMLSYFKFNKLIYARLESFMLAVIHRGMWMHRFLLSVAKSAMGENQNIEPKNKTMASVHIFEMINNLIDIETVACGKVA